jgi:hypothetical protein
MISGLRCGRARQRDPGRKRFDASLNYAVHTEYEAMNVPDDAPIVRKVVGGAPHRRVVKPEAMALRRQHPESARAGGVGTGMRDIHMREWLDINDMVSTASATELIRRPSWAAEEEESLRADRPLAALLRNCGFGIPESLRAPFPYCEGHAVSPLSCRVYPRVPCSG